MKMILLNGLALIGALYVAAVLGSSPWRSGEFPKKRPIKLIVTVPAGGRTGIKAQIAAGLLFRNALKNTVGSCSYGEKAAVVHGTAA